MKKLFLLLLISNIAGHLHGSELKPVPLSEESQAKIIKFLAAKRRISANIVTMEEWIQNDDGSVDLWAIRHDGTFFMPPFTREQCINMFGVTFPDQPTNK